MLTCYTTNNNIKIYIINYCECIWVSLSQMLN